MGVSFDCNQQINMIEECWWAVESDFNDLSKTKTLYSKCKASRYPQNSLNYSLFSTLTQLQLENQESTPEGFINEDADNLNQSKTSDKSDFNRILGTLDQIAYQNSQSEIPDRLNEYFKAEENSEIFKTEEIKSENCKPDSDTRSNHTALLLCPSKDCCYFSSSVPQLLKHIEGFHSYTCTIPLCEFSASCLCKL